jgi:hypothetical protein
MVTVEIKWATRRDLCYTAAVAREVDKKEILATGIRNMTECGYVTYEAMESYGGVGWCAWVDGNPEFAFGFTPWHVLMPHLLTAWAWGSEKIDICMPEIARWSKGGPGKPSLVDRLDVMGCVRIDARSIWYHHESHRWLEWMGFRKECDLLEWGKDRERFVQYRWLRSEWAGFGKNGQVLNRKGKKHVHGIATAASSPAPAAIDGQG